MHRKLLRALRNIVFVITGGFALVVGLNFPYNYDRPLCQEEMRAAQDYYAAAYAKPAVEAEQGEYDTKYLRTAEWAAAEFDIAAQVRAFVEEYKLGDKVVLEVGSGRG